MPDAAFWTSITGGAFALLGIGASSLTDGFKEKRRINHEVAVRQADRTNAAADRRRTFEIENLQAAYDAMWLLARESAVQHMQDMRMAKETAHGYGGAYVPEDPAANHEKLKSLSQAAKAIRLILDDEVREMALQAQSAMTTTAMLSVGRKDPVSAAEGEASHFAAVRLIDQAMNAIATRLRQAIEGTP